MYYQGGGGDLDITLIVVGGRMGFAMQTRDLLIVDKVRRDGIGILRGEH